MTYSNSPPIYHIAYSEINQKHFLSILDLLSLVKKGEFTEDTYVWKIEMVNWVKAGKLKELRPLFKKPPTVPDELKEDCQLFP